MFHKRCSVGRVKVRQVLAAIADKDNRLLTEQAALAGCNVTELTNAALLLWARSPASYLALPPSLHRDVELVVEEDQLEEAQLAKLEEELEAKAKAKADDKADEKHSGSDSSKADDSKDDDADDEEEVKDDGIALRVRMAMNRGDATEIESEVKLMRFQFQLLFWSR